MNVLATIGEPTFQTWDGNSYSFSAVGEYHLIKTDTISIQVISSFCFSMLVYLSVGFETLTCRAVSLTLISFRGDSSNPRMSIIILFEGLY